MTSTLAIQHWSLLAERIVLFLIDVSIKSVLLFAVADLLALALRRASAAQRHLVWLFMLVATLGIPIFSGLLPGHEVRAVSRAIHVDPKPTPAPIPIPMLAKSPPAPPYTATVNDHPVSAVYGDATANNQFNQTSHIAFPATEIFAVLAGLISLALSVIWILGVLLLLGRISIALLRLGVLRRDLRPLTDEAIIHEADEIIQLMNMRKSVDIFIARDTSSITVPLTWGFWGPVIVLPATAREWPKERLRAALLHELAHVKRGDWLAQMLASIICSFYWFNPLIWIASNLMRQESERAADDYALTHGLRASEYATHLLEIARTAQERRQLPRQAVAMVRQSKIEGRLREVLARDRRRQQVTRKLGIAALAITVCLLLSASAFRFSSRTMNVLWAKPVPIPTTLSSVGPHDPQFTLPNGVTVRLAGIANTQATGPTQWWTTDGSPITETLPQNRMIYKTLPRDISGRVFAINLTYDIAAQPKSDWVSPPRFKWTYGQAGSNRSRYYAKPTVIEYFLPDDHIAEVNHYHELYQEQEKQIGFQITHISIDARCSPSSRKTVSVRYAVAAGPWTESITCKKTPGKVSIPTQAGPVIFTFVPNPHHLKDASAIARGNAVFMVTDALGEPSSEIKLRQDFDRNVVALDKTGRVVYDLRSGMVYGGDGEDGANDECPKLHHETC